MQTKIQFKNLIAALAIVCLGQTGVASDAQVVVGAVGATPADLKAFATSKDTLPYSEYLDATRPGRDFESDLKARFTRAQKAWLSGNADSARAEFQALTELTLKADWRTPQREVLLTSYLRLAQSSLSGIEKTNWIEGAVRYFSDLEPHPSLFPPPLIEEFTAIRSRSLASASALELWTVFPEARFVLIDGRRIEIANHAAVRLPNGTHRVTALSDTHATFTEFLTPNQLLLFRAKPIALTEGTCSSARLLPNQTLPGKTLLFAGRDCPASTEQLDLRPQLLSSQLMNELKQPATVKAKNRTWIWVVGGALLAGAGYAIAREMNRDKSDQIQRSGF